MTRHSQDCQDPIHESRVWSDGHRTARVIKNEVNDGRAMAMFPDGEVEPALAGTWTMERDKKNPKPLDTHAFNTRVQTARQVICRPGQQRHADLNRGLAVTVGGLRARMALASFAKPRP